MTFTKLATYSVSVVKCNFGNFGGITPCRQAQEERWQIARAAVKDRIWLLLVLLL